MVEGGNGVQDIKSIFPIGAVRANHGKAVMRHRLRRLRPQIFRQKCEGIDGELALIVGVHTHSAIASAIQT